MLARFVTMRAQLITYLLFLLEILFIERLLKNGKKANSFFYILPISQEFHQYIFPCKNLDSLRKPFGNAFHRFYRQRG